MSVETSPVVVSFQGARLRRPVQTSPVVASFAPEVSPVYAAAASPLGAGLVLVDFTSPEAFANVTATSPLGAAGALAQPVTISAAQAASPLGLVGALARAVGVARCAARSPLGATAARGVVLRYELRGEVRLSGILVDRRVRAYRRADGALVSQSDTVAGRFALHAGFAADEFCVIPIDLAEGAADFTPPVANRVLSVLAEDQP